MGFPQARSSVVRTAEFDSQCVVLAKSDRALGFVNGRIERSWSVKWDLFAKTLILMSPLGAAVYEILRQRTRLPEPRISYAELARQLTEESEAFEHLFHRSRELYAALAEVGRECLRMRLPPLPALVVRADTRKPGDAYYTGRCRGGMTRGSAIAAWREDLEQVKSCRYPRRRKT
jgi:hypothetical protein